MPPPTNPAPPLRRDTLAVRRGIARHLVGHGVELGPGHNPYPLDLPGTTVAYVDRWDPDENQALFPELGDAAPFPEPDVVCDLNTDKLKALDDATQDFVIASHVLEHVADPLGLVDDIHRVLRPGGTALILLPDMRRTFDRDRPPTGLDHLVREFSAGVTEVDDDHIREFLRFTEPDYEGTVLALSPESQAELFDWHRRRSIHVHCWTEDGFLLVLDHGVRSLGHHWEFVDGVLSDDEGPDGMEFGFVLRRSPVALDPEVAASRFQAAYEQWAGQRRALHAALDAPAPGPAAPAGLLTRLWRRLD
ncbi:MAG TPA: methyltransferase domain-containing protein [Acidimicrobiales bacterium]